MPDPKTFSAFSDARKVLDRALAAERGIRVMCKSNSAAITLRRRCNSLRKIDRYENAQIYPPEHKMHRRSVYDALQLRVPPKGTEQESLLIIEKIDAIEYEIVELGLAEGLGAT